MRRYRRSMRRRRRSMWRRLRLWQRRRRSHGGHSIRRYRRSMRRCRRSARSYRRYRRGVSGDIGDCRVGITPQMSNRVTNHGDMSTFSKPGIGQLTPPVKFHQFSLLPLRNIIDLHLLMLMHNPDLTATSTNIRTSSSSLARLAAHTCHL